MAIINGTDNGETIPGTADDDTINAGGGDDTVNAGDGNDTVNGDAGNDTLNGDAGNDILNGGAGLDTLNGGTGNDTLNANGVSNRTATTETLNGGDGDDLFIYQGGRVNNNGGEGFDTLQADFSSYDRGVGTFDFGTNNAQFSNLFDGNAAFTSIERFLLTGSNFGDGFTTGAGNDIIDGGAGNDGIDAGAGDDTLTGGAGNDSLNGGAGNDIARFSGNRASYTVTTDANGVTTVQDNRTTGATDGTDTLSNIERLQFADGQVITGTPGNDNLAGSPGNDEINGGEGDDTIDGGAGNDTINGQGGNDILNGGTGIDTLNGGGGNDTLDGGAGFDRDFINGGDGNDTIRVSGGDDFVFGDAGIDTLVVDFSASQSGVFVDERRLAFGADPGPDGGTQGEFSNNLDTSVDFRSIEIFDVTTGSGDDSIRTGAGNDRIVLNGGNDTADAGAGDDTLNGGAGNDTLDGGAGTDRAVFSGMRSDYTVTTANGVTTVTDNRTTGTTDGTDTLTAIETLQFANGTFAAAPAAPVAVDDTLAATEDTAATYTFAQLTSNDTDANGDPLTVDSVTPVSGGTVVRNANGTVTFTPDANFNGPASFDYTVSDGQGGTDTGRATVNVAPVNDAPTIANLQGDVTNQIEGGATTFLDTGRNAVITDVDSTDFAGGSLTVSITSGFQNDTIGIFGDGVTGQSGSNVTVNGVVIGTFARNANGSTLTVTFNTEATVARVETLLRGIFVQNQFIEPRAGTRDITTTLTDGDGGTNSYTSQLVVTNVNDAPDGADATRTINEDTAFTFAASDFGFRDNANDGDFGFPEGQSLQSVIITTLPTDGRILLNGVAVTPGQEVSAADINAGNLRFAPDADEFGSPYGSFTFQVRDNGGTANGGRDTDQIPNTFTFNVTSDGRIEGTENGETINGTPGPDIIDARGGDDTVNAGDGNDTVNGGEGNNTLNGEAGNDTLNGDAGNDILNGGTGIDTLNGGAGNDTLNTGAFGQQQPDQEETQNGGDGNDLLIYQGGRVNNNGGDGFDTLQADFSNFRRPVNTFFNRPDGGEFSNQFDENAAFTSVERFIITGSNFNDSFTTGAGNDVIDGGAGSDGINAGAGDDTLTGGAGNDTLDGGAGNDTAVFSGNRSDYTVTTTRNADGTQSFTSVRDNRAGGGDGTDTLTSVESLRFADGGLANANDSRVRLNDSAGNQRGSFETIQAAIDASQDGDTIVVGAGTYTEQLTVTNRDNLTLVAADGATVTVVSPAMLSTNGFSDFLGSDVRAVLAVNDSENFTIRGINVDGNFSGDTTGGTEPFTGIAFLRSSGTVDNVDIEETGRSPAGGGFGSQEGSSGLLIDGGAAGAMGAQEAVTVTNSAITEFQKVGVLIDGVDINFTGNTITGIGATPLTAQNGIQISRSDGVISGNTISGLGFDQPAGDDTQATGIIAFEPTGPLAITGNTITGTGLGEDGAGNGIDLSDSTGQVFTVTGNTLTDLETGIRAVSFLGGTVGLDTNPVISDNIFTNNRIQNIFFDPETVDGGGSFITSTPFNQTGSDGTDFLAGSDGNDRFDGAAGDDTLLGRAGNDTLIGGAGNDILDGGTGADTMNGGDGDDTYFVDNAGDVIIDSSGNDRINSTGSTFTIAEGSTIESVNVTSANGGATGTGATVNGSSSADTINGSDGNDTLNGNAGDDTVNGGGGDDTINGGPGRDNLDGGAGNDTINGNEDDDRIRGGTGNDRVFGNGGNDFFFLEDGGDDSASGGSGNDIFYFGAEMTSADTVDGGAGADVVALQGDYANLTLGAAALFQVETLSLLTGSNSRFGDTANNRYSYNITSLDSNVATGARLIVNGASLLAGENLTFDGSAETDGSFLIYGGMGTDTLTGGEGNDIFFMAEGRLNSADTFNGGAGNDILIFRGDYAGANAMTFGANTIAGIETITLMSAADSRFFSGGAAYSYELTTNDGNVASGATLTINGARLLSNETIMFDGSAETDGNFRLFAGAGDDTLTAGAGNDLIFGGLGADELRGGAGNDTFRYQSTAESTRASTDRILDFATGDIIDLSAIDANSTNGAGNDAFTFIGDRAFSKTAGELRTVSDGVGGTFIEGDVDGDGVADIVIFVETPNSPPPVITDFTL